MAGVGASLVVRRGNSRRRFPVADSRLETSFVAFLVFHGCGGRSDGAGGERRAGGAGVAAGASEMRGLDLGQWVGARLAHLCSDLPSRGHVPAPASWRIRPRRMTRVSLPGAGTTACLAGRRLARRAAMDASAWSGGGPAGWPLRRLLWCARQHLRSAASQLLLSDLTDGGAAPFVVGGELRDTHV